MSHRAAAFASTSSTNAFVRALSPSIIAAGLGSEHTPLLGHQNEQLARHTAISGASSVDEVLAMVPPDYRDTLRAPLLEVASNASKLVAARAVLRKYDLHRAQGTYPSFLHSKAPTVQLSKEFAASAEGSAHRSALETAHKAYLDRQFENAHKAKSDERDNLSKLLDVQRLFGELRVVVQDRAVGIAERSKIPELSTTDNGELEVTGVWITSPLVARVSKEIVVDLPAYCLTIIRIIETRDEARVHANERKKQMAASADVEMSELTPGPSIQSLVDKAVSAKVKSLSKGKKTQTFNASKKGGPKNVEVRNYDDLRAAYRLLEPPMPYVTQKRKVKSNFAKKASGSKSTQKGKARPKPKGKGNGKGKGKGKAN